MVLGLFPLYVAQFLDFLVALLGVLGWGVLVTVLLVVLVTAIRKI